MKMDHVLAVAIGVLTLAIQASGQNGDSGREFRLLDALYKAEFMSHGPDEVKKELEGKVIGLYFTAKWCSPCRAFTPRLVRFRNEHKDKFQFVMMSWDKDLQSQIAYLTKTKMNAPAVRFDDNFIKKVGSLYGVNSVPTLLIFDSRGNLLTNGGQEHMVTAVRADEIAAMSKSDAGKTWVSMIAPIQKEMRDERAANLATFEHVFTKYKDFPHINEFKDLFGYHGTTQANRDVITKIGRTIAGDWSVKKKYLCQMPALAREMKPAKKGWRSALEASGGYCFVELGKHAVKNAEIKQLLVEFVKGDKLKREDVYLCRQWGLCGLVAAAVAGDQDAYDMVADCGTQIKMSHAQLQIYPHLYESCRNLNSRALSLAYDVYMKDPYYAYVAFTAFYPAAYKGNPKALDGLAAIIRTAKQKTYVDAARKVLIAVAGQGNEHAKRLVMGLEG